MDLSTKPFCTKEYQLNFKLKKKIPNIFFQSNSFQRKLFLTVSLFQSLSIFFFLILFYF